MSTRGSSPASAPSTPLSTTQVALTPSRKVQALLAQFSDSDSEEDVVVRTGRDLKSLSPFDAPSGPGKSSRAGIDDDDEAEDEDKIQPRGRVAARLLGERTVHSKKNSGNTVTSDVSPSKAASPSEAAATNGIQQNEFDSSEDEIVAATAARKKAPLNQTEDSMDHARSTQTRHSQSQSPLRSPSPDASRHSDSASSSPSHSTSSRSPTKKPADGRYKFPVLVEKHRKKRVSQKEQEAVGLNSHHSTPRRIRGSSPADESDENNASADEDAVKRIQKQARPTRKASKKALEEMNRETQRMSRNMQLAHQATTKKKITKESLLARFNFAPEVVTMEKQASDLPDIVVSSSVTTSDAEDGNGHSSTPPTSPISELEPPFPDIEIPQVKDITHLLISGQVAAEAYGALMPYGEQLALEEINSGKASNERLQKMVDYCRSELTVKSPKITKVGASINNLTRDIATRSSAPRARPLRNNLVQTLASREANSDSDGELEVIKERGLKRKYAAFETLPKRKAKEMPSHLALRSLAHILGADDKKRSINAAELESALRRKARVQAVEERRQKIEDLKARGIVVQSNEERERDQQEVEDLVERARQEAVEIQKRERELAKKDGTYVRDDLDDEDADSADSDFMEEEIDDAENSDSAEENDASDVEHQEHATPSLVEDAAEDMGTSEESDASDVEDDTENLATDPEDISRPPPPSRMARNKRVISDDEDENIVSNRKDQSPPLPTAMRTPQTVPRSARKMIPGLQMSDDLPMGLSQAFAATMAESQTQNAIETQEQDSLDLTADLPSPIFSRMPSLQRLDSIDLVSDSQPAASQTQPLNVNLLSQNQAIPESPEGLGIRGAQFTPSQYQLPFELTQDNGYLLSPFMGNRFAETPTLDATYSTIDTVIVPQGLEDSPVLQRRGRLQRGRLDSSANIEEPQPITAFQVMKQATKTRTAEADFNKMKSEARNIVDEAAEESEDEYAGIGGASDDSGDDEENEEDRRMIDEDTQVGKGDEAKLAGLYADRERARDEQEVSKLLKDITTGALRRKRGVGDDLDLSDEEDAAARRREVKRREFARMRRELLKDEAVGKIAGDRKKEAFLRSIEDPEPEEDDEIDQTEALVGTDDRSQSQDQVVLVTNSQDDSQTGRRRTQPLDVITDSNLNRRAPSIHGVDRRHNRKPATLAEIRESVSFLIEEPDSQAAMVDLGLSESEDEPEAYVNLDRHFREAEADENALDDDDEDLGDFVVADELPMKDGSLKDIFKKPELPRQERAHYTERRTKHTNVVDRLSLMRQSSSSVSSCGPSASSANKMAFISSKSGTNFSGVPTLLRRATTNSSLGSMSGRENVSATGVVTNKTERGNAGEEKEFVRKGSGGRRNAVNYQAERKTLREERMSARAGVRKAAKGNKGQGFLGGLFRGDSWE